MADNNSSPARFHFAGFTLDVSRQLLLEGETEIGLRPQSFAVLQLLVENHGQLVTREQLMAAVWGGRVVTDDSISQCLIDIRKAIRDTDRSMIRTVVRRGFVLETPVEIEAADAATGRSRRTAVLVTLGLLVFLGALSIVWLRPAAPPVRVDLPENSIAVLEFVDRSDDQDQAHIGFGLAEEILNTLGQSPDVTVIARTSSFAYSQRANNIADIRDELGVAYVLEGSVRRIGDGLQVAVSLVDTSNSTGVWSQRYDVPVHAINSLQLDVSREVLRRIAPGSEAGVVAQDAEDVSSSELMLLARLYESRIRDPAEVPEDTLQRTIGLYRQAVAATPDSALAHARLARVLLYDGQLAAAQVAVERALRLDPEQSEVQETLARSLWLRAEAGAGDAWLKAIELNPDNVDALSGYGFWRWMQGNEGHEDGIPYLEEALLRDPGSLSRYVDLGNILAYQTDIAGADNIIAEIRARFSSAASDRAIARLLDIIGRVDESIAWTLLARQKEPANPFHSSAVAELLIDIGDFETALAFEPEPGVGLLIKMQRYDEAIELAQSQLFDQPNDVRLHYLLGYAYLVTDQAADAVYILNRTGLPRGVQPEIRLATDIEGFFTYLEAHVANGQMDYIRPIAQRWLDGSAQETSSWWIHVHTACIQATFGREEEAFARLLTVPDSPRLPWLYVLEDSVCFRRFAADARFQAVIASVKDRQAEFRQRLPATLARFDVTLEP